MSDAFNIDALLDATLDDLADAPSFEPFHPGAHKITINFEQKKIAEHPAIEMKMKLIETVELADTSAVPQKAGSECNVAFLLDNEYGQGDLKKILTVLSAHFGTKTNRETLEAAKGAEVLVTTKIRQKDKDAPKYCVIMDMVVI
jgi:hypothetical protein